MRRFLVRRGVRFFVRIIVAQVVIVLAVNIINDVRWYRSRRNPVICTLPGSNAILDQLTDYFGADKPWLLRGITRFLGDDWLGADWLYLGIKPPNDVVANNTGELLYCEEYFSRGKYPMVRKSRFWVDPQLFMLNKYEYVWVWGEEITPNRLLANRVEIVVSDHLQLDPEAVVEGRVAAVGETSFIP